MKFIKNLLIIVLAVGFASACDDGLLEVDPSVSVTIDQAFTDPAIFESYIVGIYDELTDTAYKPRLIPWADVRGGDAIVIPTNNYGRYPTEYNFTETPNGAYGSDDLWFQGYDIVGLANPAIKALEDPDVPLTDNQKAVFEAELRAFRAQALHDLVRVFGQPYSAGRDNPGVVLNTEVLSPNDPGLGRSTVGEVYDQIVIDLERAVAVMPATQTDRTKWTKQAIQGLLARVYLDMEMWQEASDMAEAAYNGFTLMTSAEWLEGFDNPTSEWMFYAGVTSDDSHGFLSPHSFWDTRRLGYSSLRLDINFIDDNFSATDVRGIPALRQGGSGPIVNTGYISNKLEHNPGFVNQEVLMRASEMYLIYAEAQAQLGGAANIVNAQNALFAIQSRADANAVPSGNTGQALLEEIYLERRKELYAEGFAYFDLQRLQRDLDRDVSGGHYGDNLDIPFNDFRRLSPIPQFELDGNETIRDQQNPGYGS
jgi:hypothetical protein